VGHDMTRISRLVSNPRSPASRGECRLSCGSAASNRRSAYQPTRSVAVCRRPGGEFSPERKPIAPTGGGDAQPLARLPHKLLIMGWLARLMRPSPSSRHLWPTGCMVARLRVILGHLDDGHHAGGPTPGRKPDGRIRHPSSDAYDHRIEKARSAESGSRIGHAQCLHHPNP
jgi:hypothetical protein